MSLNQMEMAALQQNDERFFRGREIRKNFGFSSSEQVMWSNKIQEWTVQMVEEMLN